MKVSTKNKAGILRQLYTQLSGSRCALARYWVKLVCQFSYLHAYTAHHPHLHIIPHPSPPSPPPPLPPTLTLPPPPPPPHPHPYPCPMLPPPYPSLPPPPYSWKKIISFCVTALWVVCLVVWGSVGVLPPLEFEFSDNTHARTCGCAVCVRTCA